MKFDLDAALAKHGITPSEMPIPEKPQEEKVDWESYGTIEKLFSYLSRGQYSTVGAIKSAIRGEDIEGIADSWWKGLKGETEGSFTEVFKELERKRPTGLLSKPQWVDPNYKPPQEFQDMWPINTQGSDFSSLDVLGMTADMIIDPINVAGAAVIKPISMAAKLLKIPEGLELLGKLRPIDEALKLVVPGRGKPHYKLMREIGQETAYKRRLLMREIRDLQNDFVQVAKEIGWDPKELGREIIRVRESGLAQAGLPEEAHHFYNKIVQGLDDIGEEAMAQGLITKKLDYYFPHFLKEKKTGEIVKSKHYVKRSQETMDDLEDYLKQLAGDGIEKGKDIAKNTVKINQLEPVINPVTGYGLRKLKHIQSLQRQKFLSQTLDEFGTPLHKIIENEFKMPIESLSPEIIASSKALGKLPLGNRFILKTGDKITVPQAKQLKDLMLMKEMESPSGFKKILSDEALASGGFFTEVGIDDVYRLYKGGKLPKGTAIYSVPNAVAEDLSRALKPMQKPNWFIKKIYDPSLNAFKTMATSMRIPFHARNALSNTHLMYLSGVEGQQLPRRIAQGARLLMKKGEYFGKSADEMFDLADQLGVRGYGLIGADIPSMAQKEVIHASERAKSWMPMKREGWRKAIYPAETVARVGRRVGTNIEDTARVGAWLDRMEKTGIASAKSPEEFKKIAYDAAVHMKKYLFDYTELTDFERRYLKRFFPFYSWMRKNIPLQIEQLATQPEKYARLAKFKEHLSPLTPAEQQDMPEHWEDTVVIKTPFKDDMGNRVYAHLDLPLNDLARIQNPLQMFLGALTPAKAVGEITTSVYTWPRIHHEKERDIRTIAPFWASYLPQPFTSIADIGPYRDPGTGNVVLGMNKAWKYGLETAFPFLGEWSNLYPQPATLRAEQGKGGWKLLSTFTGIRFEPLDVTAAKRGKIIEKKEKMKNIYRLLYKGQSDTAKERLEELQKSR